MENSQTILPLSPKILAIESSCDETSASVISGGRTLSNIISSQHFHSKYGGVIPELASRAHIRIINEVVADALETAGIKIEDINALAVTKEPGLIGSLLVGSNFAKGLSLKYNIPVIPVNHIEGHLYSGCLQDPGMEFPFISLVVSGGHTSLFFVESYSKYSILGSTRDDAAGEAFDKIAALLKLGYPGGPLIDEHAKDGDPKKYDFPRSMINDKSFDFSFSGLKTAVRYFIHNNFQDGVPEKEAPNICASAQAAITDVLVKKTIKAAKWKKVKWIVVAGGVSANSDLRRKMDIEAEKIGVKSIAPDLAYCMDNAAMIGFIAEKKLELSKSENYFDLSFTVNSSALRAPKKKKKKS